MSIFADCFKWQCQINFLELLIWFLNPFCSFYSPLYCCTAMPKFTVSSARLRVLKSMKIQKNIFMPVITTSWEAWDFFVCVIALENILKWPSDKIVALSLFHVTTVIFYMAGSSADYSEQNMLFILFVLIFILFILHWWLAVLSVCEWACLDGKELWLVIFPL